MTRAIAILTGIGFAILLTGCSANGAPSSSIATSPAAPPCADPMAIIKAFYDSNDAAQYDASLAFLTPDVTLASWGEGVNGRHWQEQHLSGQEQIRAVLGNRGLRRTSGQPNTPIFHETEAKISGSQVTFMLRPDRRSPDGRPYNPYKVEAIFQGCQIKSLTLIEVFSGV